MSLNVTMAVKTETEEAIVTRLKKSFKTLDTLTFKIALGSIRSMIVYGPPGCGKTFNITTTLRAHKMFNDTQGIPTTWTRYSGSITPIQLYKLLYQHRAEGTTLVLDDIDSVFKNQDSLNLLKAAVDSNDKRELSYLTSSYILKQDDIPSKFEYKGGIIIVTNTNVNAIKGARAKHLAALISRSHYMDLDIDTDADKFAWLKHVTLEGNMLLSDGVSPEEATEIVEFIEENIKRMNELTLRMVSKVADLYKSLPDQWEDIAETTLMKRDTACL